MPVHARVMISPDGRQLLCDGHSLNVYEISTSEETLSVDRVKHAVYANSG
jgi:hypothetical protein